MKFQFIPTPHFNVGIEGIKGGEVLNHSDLADGIKHK